MGVELVTRQEMSGLDWEAVKRFAAPTARGAGRAFWQQLQQPQGAPPPAPPPPPTTPTVINPANNPSLFTGIWSQVDTIRRNRASKAVIARNLRAMADAVERNTNPTFRATRSEIVYPYMHF